MNGRFTEAELTAARDQKIEQLLADVRDASARYEMAKQDEQFARNAVSDALNKLNAAQRVMDAAIENERIISPRGSDWNASTQR